MGVDTLSIAGSWLLTYLLHSTLLLGLAWGMTYRLVRSPALRDVVWKTALVGGLVSATLQVGSGWEPLGGAVSLSRATRAVVERPTVGEAWHGEMLAPVSVSRAAPLADLASAPVEATTEASLDPAADAALPAAESPRAPLTLAMVLAIAVGLWLALGLAFFLRYLVQRVRVMRRIGPRRQVVEPVLVSMLETLRHTGQVRQRVHLTAAGGLSSPVALGRDEIALPEAALTDLDRDQQRGMLAHELAHLVRRDPSWLTTACVIERLFFLQPLNRVARIRMQEAAELLCDDWAVRRTGSGFSLASCLVKVAEWIDTPPHPVPMTGMAEHRSQLVTRIHRLIEARPMPTAPRSLWFAAGAVALLGVTAVAAPGVTARPPLPQASAEIDPLAGEDSESIAYAASLAGIADTDSVVERSHAGDYEEAILQARLNRARAASSADMRRALVEARAVGRARVLSPLPPRAPMAPMAPRPAIVGWGSADARAPRAQARAQRELLAEMRRSHGGWARGGDLHERSRDTTSIAVPALITALKDSDVEVRRIAAQSLGGYRDPRAIPGLVDALKDSDTEVRVSSAVALANLEDARALPGLLAALKDSNREVRQTALSALYSMPGGAPDDAILASLNDSDAEVRETAISLALSKMSDLHEDGTNAADPRFVAAFGKLLGDANTDVRERAAEGLGVAGLKEAPAALLTASRDKSPSVRSAVARSLGMIGNARGVPTLKEMISDGSADVREAAVESLSMIRDQAALEALVGALKSTDPVVRRTAAEALGQRGD